MKRPHWLSVIGGPNALSIWTWLISVIWTVSVIGVLDPLQQGSFTVTWLLAVIASQGMVGIGLWVAMKTVLPGQGDPPRPFATISVLASLGALRAVTMQMGSIVTEHQDQYSLADRLVFGISYSLIFGILVALVVDGARTHASTMGHLRAAQIALNDELASDEREVDGLHEDLVRDTQEQLLTALSATDLTPEQIRGWARDVIRPISHELASTPDEFEPEQQNLVVAPTSVPIQERARRVGMSMRPPSPLTLVVITESLAFPIAFQYESLEIAVAHTAIGSVFILVTMLIFSRLYRPASSALANFLRIVLGTIAVAGAAVFATDLIVRWIFPSANSYLIYVVSILLIGLALSIYPAIRSTQDDAEAEIAMVIGVLIQRRQENARAIRLARIRASRFLHNSIQGILYAGALSKSDPRDIHRDVLHAFESFAQPVPTATPADLRARFDDLIELWRHALDVQVKIDDDADELLFRDSHRTERVLSVISEGLTNAAKHSTGASAVVHLETSDQVIVLTVTTPGGLATEMTPGLGSRHLTAATNQWSISGDSRSTVLTAHIG